MNLYEINTQIMDAYDKAIDTETGEILDESLFSLIDELEMQRDEKIKNLGLWVKNLKSDVNSIDEEIKALQAMKERKKSKVSSIERYIQGNLQGNKFDGGIVQISFRKTQSVMVEDIERIPDAFKRVKTTIEADKMALKEALKNGEIIDGAMLMDNLSMTIK